jgi:hypothetical protein
MSDTELVLLVESRKKSRFVAILLNIFLPGAGYMYCGRWILGIVAFFFVILLVVVSLGVAAIGLYIVLIVDAALCVGRYNRRMTEDLIRSRAQLKRGANGTEDSAPQSILTLDKPKSGWKTAGTYIGGAFLVVFGIAAFGLIAEKAKAGDEDLLIQTPECGAPEATELIRNQLNYEIESGLAMLGYGAAAAGMTIFEVVDAEEIFFDEASGFRACLAKSRHKNGYGVTGYTIEWENKSEGYFRAKIVDPGVLAATYREKTETPAP